MMRRASALILAACVALAVSPAPAQTPENVNGAAVSASQIEDLRDGVALGAAESSKARPINRLTIALIMAAEGWRDVAYDDPSGYCTIGYGHLIALQRCGTLDLRKLGFSGHITSDIGTNILFQDTTSARIAVSKLVTVDLDDNQFGAIVSFTFNVGKRNFEKSTLLKLVNVPAFKPVPKELRRWSSSGGRVLPGLLARRSCEGSLFVSELHLSLSKQVDLASCGSLGVAADIVNPIDVSSGE